MIKVSTLNVGNVINCLCYKLIECFFFLLPWSVITHVYCRTGSMLWCCHNIWRKEHICKFVTYNICKEHEDNNRCVKLGVTCLTRDASSSDKKRTSDCNDPLLNNHITQYIKSVVDDTYFAQKYLKQIVDKNLPLLKICSRCHLILLDNKEY